MAKKLKVKDMSKCIGCFSCMHVCSAANYQNHSLKKSAIRIKTSGGLSSKFHAIVCIGCTDPACAEVCMTGALVARDGGGVTLYKDKCIGCGRCEKACIASAIVMDGDLKLPIVCRECGICPNFCPHGCLAFEE